MTDIVDFVLNTDYQTPYILKTFSAQFTITSSDCGTIGSSTIAHGLPFTPLIIGVWLDSNNGIYRDISNSRPDGPFSMPTVITTVVSDATNIYFEVYDAKYPYETTTYTFKVACLAPPNFTGDTNLTSSIDNTNFTFNTSYVAPQIFKSGYIDVAANSTVSVPHGLAFSPKCRVWRNNMYLQSNFTANKTGMDIPIRVDDTNIYLTTGYGNPTVRFYYHIYGDNVWA